MKNFAEVTLLSLAPAFRPNSSGPGGGKVWLPSRFSMSDPRITYPQAKAWTFLLDTPDDTGSSSGGGSGSGTKPAPQTAKAAGGGGGARPAAGAKTRGKRKTSLGDSSNCSGGEDMGAMCSKPANANLATDKENMDMEEMLVPNGDSSSPMARDVAAAAAAGAEAGGAAPGAGSKDQKALADEAAVLGAAMLESTAFLSPEPEEVKEGGEEDGGNSAVDGNGEAIAGLEIERGGHAGSFGDGHMRYEDRAEWIARNLEMLPRGSCAVEVDQLKQVGVAKRARVMTLVGVNHVHALF